MNNLQTLIVWCVLFLYIAICLQYIVLLKFDMDSPTTSVSTTGPSWLFFLRIVGLSGSSTAWRAAAGSLAGMLAISSCCPSLLKMSSTSLEAMSMGVWGESGTLHYSSCCLVHFGQVFDMLLKIISEKELWDCHWWFTQLCKPQVQARLHKVIIPHQI